MIYLIYSLLILLSAPILYHFTMRFQRSWRAIERLLTVSVTALVVLHLLPESMAAGGWPCILFALVGLFLPSLFERVWHKEASKIHLFPIIIGTIGLLIHGMMDGGAIALGSLMTDQPALPIAVLLHRLPVGVLLWSLFAHESIKLATSLLILLAAATTLGYFFAWELPGLVQQNYLLPYFQSLVSGSLLHLAFDRHDH